MSDENRTEGRACYAAGDAKLRSWFERQWAIWPARADQHRTTNLSFHHGGVLAFREIHGCDPAMSRELKSNVEWFDKQEQKHG